VNPQLRIHAVILAGGEGRRMGRADKALLPLAGRTLVAHAIARVAPQVSAVAISANGDPARFAGSGLPVLADARPLGPLSGILAGLDWAAGQGAGALLSVPVDAPFLPADLAMRLAEAASADAPAFATSGGRPHPVVALWPVALAAPLAAFLDSGAKARVLDFITAQGGRAVAFLDPAAFVNLNAPEDLTEAAARLGVQR